MDLPWWVWGKRVSASFEVSTSNTIRIIDNISCSRWPNVSQGKMEETEAQRAQESVVLLLYSSGPTIDPNPKMRGCLAPKCPRHLYNLSPQT